MKEEEIEFVARLRSKGKITIPIAVREAIGAKVGKLLKLRICLVKEKREEIEKEAREVKK